jgi:hypothetical protein
MLNRIQHAEGMKPVSSELTGQCINIRESHFIPKAVNKADRKYLSIKIFIPVKKMNFD